MVPSQWFVYDIVLPPLVRYPIIIPWLSYYCPRQQLLVGGAMCPSWKMMEFVNAKDDIPYMKWKIKFMFQTTNQFLSMNQTKQWLELKKCHVQRVSKLHKWIVLVVLIVGYRWFSRWLIIQHLWPLNRSSSEAQRLKVSNTSVRSPYFRMARTK